MADYRVDELARAAGTTVRNVRVYQDRGLLPPPRKAGRVGIYDDAHLGRLRLIGTLLERGFTFAHIADFLTGLERGDDLAEVLGLEAAITAPWTEEEPTRVSAAELRRMFGVSSLTPKVLTRATAAGLIVREGSHFLAPAPSLLRAGADLVAAGVPLVAVLDLADSLRRDARSIARQFVGVVLDHVATDDFPHGQEAAHLAETVQRLRPHARAGMVAALAQAMEEEVAAVLSKRVAGSLREP